VKAEQVVEAIRHDYCSVEDPAIQPEWAMLTEHRAWVQHPVAGQKRYYRNERSIDVMLFRTYASGRGFERIAFEVKVSRSDYNNETPEKRAPAEGLAHRCAYAAPVGLIDPATLPDGWGLLEIHEERGTKPFSNKPPFNRYGSWRKGCKTRTPTHDMDGALAMVARRAYKVTEMIRRGEGDAAQMAALRDEYRRLEGQFERQGVALDRERQRRKDAERLMVANGEHICADCGQPLRPTWKQHQEFWTHAKRMHNEPCREKRAEARAQEREAATGAHYLRGLAYYIETVAEREARLADDEERQVL
jgi:hypothetical protein